jgi:hypothetical protein
MHAQLIIHNCQGIASHSTGAGSVIARVRHLAAVRSDFGVGVDIASRQNFVSQREPASR